MGEIRCAECGHEELASSVESFLEEGWMFVTLIGGGLGWICHDCALEHQEKIAEIQEKYFKVRG
jgi:hypothetical protein